MSLSPPAHLAAALEAAGPFEPRPHLAVGVSGGSDSLALVLLADAWARQQGGQVTALTVDHRLRPAAAEEARQVGAWLAARGIAHHILTPPETAPPKTRANLQEQARLLRLGLLQAWCAGAGVLHLLLGHTREDQAETLLLRLLRGSGAFGLAAMAPQSFTDQVQCLRPLLSCSRAALQTFLRDQGQDWITDPSNENTAFTRVRVRQQLLPAVAAEGADAPRLAATARRLGRARAALEAEVRAVLGRGCTLSPLGWAEIDRSVFQGAAPEVALRALSQVVTGVGGRRHGPREERLDHCYAALLAGQPATLSGCRVFPLGETRWAVVRETRGLPESLILRPGESLAHWDGRFSLGLGAQASTRLRVVPLRQAGCGLKDGDFGAPPGALASLPVFLDLQGGCVAPLLGYNSSQEAIGGVNAVFAPHHCLCPAIFRFENAP